MKKLLLSIAVCLTAGASMAQVDTLTEFFTGTPTLYNADQPGYVTGNSDYADLGKGQRFNVGNGIVGTGDLTEVLLSIPAMTNAGGGTFDVVVKEFNAADTTLGATLATATVNMSDIDTAVTAFGVAEGAVIYNVAVSFSSPVAVTDASDIFVDVVLPTTAGDTIGIMSNTAGDYAASADYVFETWGDGTFSSISAAWGGLDIALGIFPVFNYSQITVVGVEENTFSANVFPNPATDVLNISTEENIASVSIVGLDGKVVSSNEVNGTTTSVDVSSLKAGVYVYVINAESGATVRNTFVKK